MQIEVVDESADSTDTEQDPESTTNPEPLTYNSSICIFNKTLIPVVGTLLSALTPIFSAIIIDNSSDDRKVHAATALISSSQISLMTISGSFLYAVNILGGRKHGEGDHSYLGVIWRAGIITSFVCFIPTEIILLNFRRLLIAFGQEESVADLVQNYFNGYAWGIPAFLFSMNCEELTFSVDQQPLALIPTSIGYSVLALLGYALVNGKLGFSQYGVQGMGYAAATQEWVRFFTYLSLYKFLNRFNTFNLISKLKCIDFTVAGNIFSLGFPIFLSIAGKLSATFLMSLMAGWLGVGGLETYNVASQYMYVAILVVVGLSQSNMSLVSRAFGARKFKDARTLGNGGIISGVLIMSALTVLFAACPRPLISVFGSANTSISKLEKILPVMAAGEIVEAAGNAPSGALMGLGYTRFPAVVSVTCLWLIGIPAILALTKVADADVMGIFGGYVIAMLVRAVFLLWRWNEKSSLTEIEKRYVAVNARVNVGNSSPAFLVSPRDDRERQEDDTPYQPLPDSTDAINASVNSMDL